LRQGINLRSYGERRPLVEFKNEGFRIFQEMIFSFKLEVIEKLFRIQGVREENTRNVIYDNERQQAYETKNESILNTNSNQSNPQDQTSPKQTPYVNRDKVGRNDPCPCGSQKKYKHCCLSKS